jgi:two-component sensor histidine kinase/PAS domain-containing protein
MIKNHVTLPQYRTLILLVFALPVLYFISRHNYNLFHSLADGVSIVIAACVFAIIWNGRRIVDNDYFLYVGIAFLFFAFWDLMHLLGNKNMGVFPEYGNLGPALYIISRYILSISLLIAPLFINRKLNTTLMYAAYSLVTLLVLLSIFYWHIFPVCIVDGVGLTPFKVVSDYIICLILLGSIGLLLINRRSFDSRVLWLIVSSIILSIATGLAFTLYADPFGIMNATGHFFQIASFSLIYIAFIETSLTKPQDILYRKLKQKEEELVENVKQVDAANVKLKREVAERKQAEEALRESELLRRLSIDNMLEGYALHEAIFDEKGRMVDYRFLEFNPSAQKIANVAREEIVGRTAKELYSHIMERGLIDRYADVMATGIPAVIDDFYYAGDHLNKALDIACFRIDDRHFACVFRDITDSKRVEEKIKASLLEKETMLKEIHHRVKNNLQVISSLLGLQCSYIKDEESREIFQESQNRVRIMAQIHTMLYQSADLARVDFGGFIRDLAGRLQQSYGGAGSPIEIQTDIANVSLSIETSIPCGLILNELVANALKYAFPEGKEGEIHIRMRSEDNRVALTVQDNGIGFPASIDFRNTQSLGLELVNLLVGQMSGTIDMQVGGGTTWTITFPIKNEREWRDG